MFPIDFWTLKCIKVSDNDQLAHIKTELMAGGGFEISYYHCMLIHAHNPWLFCFWHAGIWPWELWLRLWSVFQHSVATRAITTLHNNRWVVATRENDNYNKRQKDIGENYIKEIQTINNNNNIIFAPSTFHMLDPLECHAGRVTDITFMSMAVYSFVSCMRVCNDLFCVSLEA